RK
ncbi:inclusion membrane domain protein, partial [Chlamydia psittaci 84-8471/1]